MVDIYCPGCGLDADEVGYTELEGYFATGVYIFECDECGALIQDGEWFSKADAMAKFHD